MASTYGDWVAITGSGTANAESAQSTMEVTQGCVITEISVASLTVGTTYAVKIDAPGLASPQKYVMGCNGAAANTNGGKVFGGNKRIKCRIVLPSGCSTVKISTYAGVASATCRVGLKWVA